MKVIVHWSGGKDCCTALHKVVEQGHEVACLVTYIYMEPYAFHSFKVIEQQAKALDIPHQFVKITDNRYTDIMGTLERLHKEEGAKAIVTGDIDNVHHRRVWKDACRKLGYQLIMPLWDRRLNLIPGNRRRKRIMELEQATGIKAILSCIDQRYFTPDWLGRPIDRKCIEDMQPLVGPPGKGIDVSGEPGEYHSTSLDAPLFKQRVEITKFTKQNKVIDFGGSPFREGNFLYMDVEEAMLKPKDSTSLPERPVCRAPLFEVNTVDDKPISKEKLALLMVKAWFANLGTYGDFEFGKFDETQSANIIIVGKKTLAKKARAAMGTPARNVQKLNQGLL